MTCFILLLRWEGDRGCKNINSRWAVGGREEGSGWSRVAFHVIFEINLHVIGLIIWFGFSHQTGPYSDGNIKNKTFATKNLKAGLL